jgi:hypothetical protein
VDWRRAAGECRGGRHSPASLDGHAHCPGASPTGPTVRSLGRGPSPAATSRQWRRPRRLTGRPTAGATDKGRRRSPFHQTRPGSAGQVGGVRKTASQQRFAVAVLRLRLPTANLPGSKERGQGTVSLLQEGSGAPHPAGGDALPSTMKAEVGELIRLRDDNLKAAYVGQFYIPVGETVTMRITSARVLKGLCAAHPDSRFTITVRS